MKRVIGILMIGLLLLSLFACGQSGGEERERVIHLGEREVSFGEASVLSATQRHFVAEQLVMAAPATERRAWACRLFGHTVTEEVVTLTLHRVAEESPCCQAETWQISLCTRCDQVEKGRIDQFFLDCCEQIGGWADYEQDLYGEQLTTPAQLELFLTVRANASLSQRQLPTEDPAGHLFGYLYRVEDVEGTWYITEQAGCLICGHSETAAPYTKESHAHQTEGNLRYRIQPDAQGARVHVREIWCTGCNHVEKIAFPCLRAEESHCDRSACIKAYFGE